MSWAQNDFVLECVSGCVLECAESCLGLTSMREHTRQGCADAQTAVDYLAMVVLRWSKGLMQRNTSVQRDRRRTPAAAWRGYVAALPRRQRRAALMTEHYEVCWIPTKRNGLTRSVWLSSRSKLSRRCVKKNCNHRTLSYACAQLFSGQTCCHLSWVGRRIALCSSHLLRAERSVLLAAV